MPIAAKKEPRLPRADRQVVSEKKKEDPKRIDPFEEK
jgi:hypothetical protein